MIVLGFAETYYTRYAGWVALFMFLSYLPVIGDMTLLANDVLLNVLTNDALLNVLANGVLLNVLINYVFFNVLTNNVLLNILTNNVLLNVLKNYVLLKILEINKDLLELSQMMISCLKS